MRRRVQNPIVLEHVVSAEAELSHDFFQKAPMFPDGEATGVLQNEIFGAKIENQANEMMY